MKQVSLRDFQRNFCKLKGESCNIFDSHGVIIGRYRAGMGLPKPVGQPLEKKSTFAQLKEQFSGSGIVSDSVGQLVSGKPPCIFCKKESASPHTFWEDGEEKTVDVCFVCAKRKSIKLKL